MSGANRQKPPRKRDATAADRNALCRALNEAGIVRLVIYANRSWLAEMLHQAGGFCHADAEDRAALESGMQALVDHLIELAEAEQPIRVTRDDAASAYGDSGKDETP